MLPLKPLMIACFMLNTCAGAVMAQSIPIAHPQDSRIKMVAFQENNVVPIHGKTFTATQIVFGDNEYVKGIEGGDTAGWIVDYKPQMPNMIFIKPTVLGSSSNITVITNKHQYYFKVTSNKKLDTNTTLASASDSSSTSSSALAQVPAQEAMYALKFLYPEEERQKLNARLHHNAQLKDSLINQPKNPKHYNWNYRFSGNKQIMPLHVFDDGTFTYFELKPNQAVPALFAVEDLQGKEAVVNTRRQGDYLVVQRLAPQFTLRYGGAVASVFNSHEIAQIKQGRRS